jgi:hypothetical protein
VGHAGRHRPGGRLDHLRRLLCAIAQNDLMRLIAYTSISHFGFIVLGIFAMTTSTSGWLERST